MGGSLGSVSGPLSCVSFSPWLSQLALAADSRSSCLSRHVHTSLGFSTCLIAYLSLSLLPELGVLHALAWPLAFSLFVSPRLFHLLTVASHITLLFASHLEPGLPLTFVLIFAHIDFRFSVLALSRFLLHLCSLAVPLSLFFFLSHTHALSPVSTAPSCARALSLILSHTHTLSLSLTHVSTARPPARICLWAHYAGAADARGAAHCLLLACD